jgi:hypothetical protein
MATSPALLQAGVGSHLEEPDSVGSNRGHTERFGDPKLGGPYLLLPPRHSEEASLTLYFGAAKEAPVEG